MSKLLVICGPTATGKTGLGIRLARKFSGEIVSADSRQVYRGMNVGTGKEVNNQINKFQIIKSISNDKFQIGYYEVKGVKIWLYDVAEPDYRFSVADYVQCANLVIKNIWQRNKLPIIVGGTGFYIEGLTGKIGTIGIAPDWKLREELQSDKVSELQRKIKKLDLRKWERMNESDRKNPRRLIRAIEIAIKKEKPKTKKKRKKLESVKILTIGLRASNEILYQRIDERVDQRVKQGVEKEIKQLLKRGFDWKNSVLGSTLGYQEWQPLFREKKEDKGLLRNIKKEIIQRWKFNEHGYARRQMTWFKKALRQAQGKWFDITQQGWQNEVAKLAKAWYSEKEASPSMGAEPASRRVG